MIENPLNKLKETFGESRFGEENHIYGEPCTYNCSEHGVQVVAVTYYPYDSPDYICKECGNELSIKRLD